MLGVNKSTQSSFYYFDPSSAGTVRLASHSLIKVEAVLVRFPGENFVRAGQGSWFAVDRGVSTFLKTVGVVSEELYTVQ